MQMVHLGIEFTSWCSMVLMLLIETKIYVKEFRWYIRFGVIYVLVGDAVIFNLILPLKEFYVRLVSAHYFFKYALNSLTAPQTCIFGSL